MDANTALETVIKAKLTEILGGQLANFAITSAKAALVQGNTDQEKLKLAVESICSSPKVMGMWGVAELQKQKQEWLKLLY